MSLHRRRLTRAIALVIGAATLTACASSYFPPQPQPDRIQRSLNTNPSTVGQDDAVDDEGTPIER